MAITLDADKGITYPSWTTAGRPAAPVAGQSGYNTTLGFLETYSGSAWVSFNNALNVSATSVNTNNTFGFKNRIINGDQRIDQRNAGVSVAVSNATNTFITDRWSAFENCSGAFSWQQVTDAPTGFIYSLKGTITTANSSPLAADLCQVKTTIEGLNVADLLWGTANAKTITLSFWVKSSLTGTFGGALGNNALNRSYPFNYTISSANTWEVKTVTIAGDTSGTWLTDNNTGVYIFFDMGTGSDKLGTAGAWTGADTRGATGDTKLIATLNATWQISGAQFEIGTQATSFDFRDYTRELQLCQRYYEICSGTYYNANSVVNYFGTAVNFAVTKRASPTIALVATQASGGVNASPGVYGEAQSIYGFRVMALSTVSGTMYFQSTLSASIEL